jgi:hypothetical protein
VPAPPVSLDYVRDATSAFAVVGRRVDRTALERASARLAIMGMRGLDVELGQCLAITTPNAPGGYIGLHEAVTGVGMTPTTPAAGLLYTFGDPAGAGTVVDQVGSNDGTLAGSPVLGVRGALPGEYTAIRLDGVNDGVAVPGLAVTGTTFSISGLFRPDSSQASASGAILNDLGGATGGLYYDRVSRKFDLFYSGASHLLGSALTDGQWVSFVVSVSAGTASLFVDGVLVGTTASVPSHGEYDSIGIGPGPTYLKGELQFLAYWPAVALTADNVRMLHLGQSPASSYRGWRAKPMRVLRMRPDLQGQYVEVFVREQMVLG